MVCTTNSTRTYLLFAWSAVLFPMSSLYSLWTQFLIFLVDLSLMSTDLTLENIIKIKIKMDFIRGKVF